MSTKRKTNKNNETLLIIIGSFLLIIAFVLFHYEKILEVSSDIKSSIDSEIYKEKTKNNNISIDVNVNYLENDNIDIPNNRNNYVPNYIAFLEIDKIGLKQGILPKNDYYNNVNYHIQMHQISDMPDVLNGNLILAGHSGNSNIAFFKNLYKLKIGDIAKVTYKGKIYSYKIVNIYNEIKDGSINIYRNSDKTTLTLITCTKNDKEHQTIYISELISVDSY